MSELIFNKDVFMGDTGSYANRAYFKGDKVFSFSGCTYGCIGPGGRAVTEVEGEGPFFEMPRDALSLNVPMKGGSDG